MELVRYVLPHFIAGGIAGLVCAVVLVATSPSLRDLVLHSESGWLGFALLAWSFILTFAPVAAGHAIMMIGRDEE